MPLLQRLPLDPVHLRLALRATMAAGIAFLLAEFFELAKGYWAVLTAILVMQSTIGASLSAALDRLFGTLLGGVLGVLGAWVAGPSLTLTGIALLAGVLVTVYLAAKRPSLKLAAVTVAIVLLSDPSHAEPVRSALERLAEIGLGACVGLATSYLFLPSRAVDHLRKAASATLDHCGELVEVATRRLLGGTGEAGEVDRLNGAIRKQLRALDARTDEAKSERRAGHAADSPDPAPIVRTLRRIWHDELILLRAGVEPWPPALQARLGPSLEVAAQAMRARMALLAQALADRRAPEDSRELATAVGALARGAAELRGSDLALDSEQLNRLFAVAFGFQQLQNNLRDLGQRVAEQAGRASRALSSSGQEDGGQDASPGPHQ